MNNYIKIKNLTKKYEKNKSIKVLIDVSFSFESGKTYSTLSFNNIAEETIAQNNPAIATVVNLGVSFLHLKDTEKTEKPIADANPKIKPKIEDLSGFSKAIIIIPTAATVIAIQTL